MELSKQVCALEYAKRLKELGLKQGSHFYYHWYKKNRDYEDIRIEILTDQAEEFDDGKWKLKVYSAFTLSELLEYFPEYLEDDKGNIFEFELFVTDPIYKIDDDCNSIQISPREYTIGYSFINIESYKNVKHYKTNSNPANAAAELLIYLLEKGLLKNDQTKNENY